MKNHCAHQYKQTSLNLMIVTYQCPRIHQEHAHCDGGDPRLLNNWISKRMAKKFIYRSSIFNVFSSQTFKEC